MRISNREILTHAERVSHELAVQKADHELERHHKAQLAEPLLVEHDFENTVNELKKLPPPIRKKKQP